MRFIKSISVLSALIIALGSLSCFCVNAENTSGDLASAEISLNKLSEESYAEYLTSYSKYAEKEIVKQLNGIVLENDNIEFEIDVDEEGLYGIGMSYRFLDLGTSDATISLKVDGLHPYVECSKLNFPRMWCDSKDQIATDPSGNEFTPQQVLYENYCFNNAYDETVAANERYTVWLDKGKHNISLLSVNGKIAIEYFAFNSVLPSKKYTKPSEKLYDGDRIIIEGEKAKVKSGYFLVGKTDSSSTAVTPQSAERNLINYIGGGNWKTVGDSLIWETPELEEGYYKIGLSFRQNSVIGGKTYRKMTIDGETPFSEAEKIGFEYGDSWQQKFFSDKNNAPYLVYFPAGKHEIALTVTSGDIGSVRAKLTDAVEMMSELYIDITMITGETVDVYRDYNLFKQIGDMEKRLKVIRNLLQDAAANLLSITGEKSGSNYSVINNMIEAINQMLNNKYEAHKYKSYYYSNYCSVSSVLQELRQMPLDIDKISLVAADEEEPFKNSSLFDQLLFSVKRFIVSFTRDYTAISKKGSDNSKNITVWVNWGRDQAQVLSSLITRTFTPYTEIDVDLKLVNATIIQATLSGNGPDVVLQHPRSEPVNLAMRGVLYDLSQFDDCDEVLKRFQPTADTPYRYKGGLYALPDTQSFFMMFYRKDILKQFGIEVPKTWDDFRNASKLLMRNNMSVYLPNTPATDAAQINAGVGSNNIFPSLLLQNNISLYSEDGMKTNLLLSETMEIFEEWTEYYTMQKFPVSMDFYNRFRTGTTPLGIGAYTLYTTFKVAAPEIDGLWGICPVPGSIDEDGVIRNTVSGGGTGCSILKSSNDVKSAWEFLKWWTDAETQLTYSNDLESILGPSGRVALSNVDAIKGLDWESEMLDEILKAWEKVEEIPEYPGSYYVSRSIYQSFWNVVNDNKNTKDMLLKYGREANEEIARKWEQYRDRN